MNDDYSALEVLGAYIAMSTATGDATSEVAELVRKAQKEALAETGLNHTQFELWMRNGTPDFTAPLIFGRSA